ncbi:MAG: hypothetical protein PHT19_03705 [Methylococcus sp.]|nr:hypothetical protein [Methylococcus sp.]
MTALRLPIPHSETAARLAAAALMTWLFVVSVGVGDIINKDGVLYLDAAQTFLDQGLKAAMAVYGWPGYSILIAAVSRFSGWSLETSAHLVNAVCFLGIADSFVRLYFVLMGDSTRRTGWVPVLLILGFPALADRLNIVRDWGFLAASLWGLLHLAKFRFDAAGKFKHAVLWQIGISAALMFRIEALVLMLAAPLYFLFESLPWRLRARNLFFPISGVVPALLALAGLLATGRVAPGKLWEITAYGYHDPALIWTYFSLHADRVAAAMPSGYGADYAKLILGAGLTATLLWLLGANLGPVMLGLAGLSMYRFGGRLPARFRLILWSVGAASAALLVFLAVQLIPDPRYALLPSTLLLLAACVYLERFVSGSRSSWGRRLALALLVGLCAKNALVTPDYRLYLRDVGRWMRDNIPAHASLATNDPRIDYYAGRHMNPDRLRQLMPVNRLADWLTQPDLPEYLALRLTSPNDLKKAEKALNLEPVKVFSPSPREQVLIYKLDHRASGAP